jgi:hypothetical protein
MDLVTEAARALIGVRSDWVEATHPVEPSELRRFLHATMDTGTRRFPDAAPLGFPVHAFRRAASDTKDPLEGRGDPEFDGETRMLRPHLPRMPIPLSGVLNGGYEYEFFSHARIGERIFCRSAYRDVRQRQGRSGPMAIVTIEDEFVAGEEHRRLLSSTTHLIIR